MATRAIARENLTVEALKESLHYDPETGFFTRLHTYKSVRAGERAGSIGAYGYRNIRLHGSIFSEAWLAWFYMTGAWPKEQIDHINGSRVDNRFANLREATIVENLQNKGKQKRNTSGYKGVCYSKKAGKWQASIMVDRKLRHLGQYETPEAAHKVYCDAALQFHGRFANTGQ